MVIITPQEQALFVTHFIEAATEAQFRELAKVRRPVSRSLHQHPHFHHHTTSPHCIQTCFTRSRTCFSLKAERLCLPLTGGIQRQSSQTLSDLDGDLGDPLISFNLRVPGLYPAVPKVQRELSGPHSASHELNNKVTCISRHLAVSWVTFAFHWGGRRPLGGGLCCL